MLSLCMIVKNESRVIERCLRSVSRIIDNVLIIDTGSTDNTKELIANFCIVNKIPYEILDSLWVDFAHNRTEALVKLKENNKITYSLMIDADETIVYDDFFDVDIFKNNLTEDAYYIKTKMSGIEYYRPQLLSNSKSFKYNGVLHEYVDCNEVYTKSNLVGITNIPIQDGARSKDPKKYSKDAELLLRAVKTEKDKFLLSRYTFYLAQSYRDAGLYKQSLQYYQKRVPLGYWNEEIYISLLNIARLKEKFSYPENDIIQSYLSCYEYMPARLESMYELVKYYRLNEKYNLAYLIGSSCIYQNLKKYDGALFLENWIYEYGFYDEFSIVAYWSGNYSDAYHYAKKILDTCGNTLSKDQHKRIADNVMFAEKKLFNIN